MAIHAIHVFSTSGHDQKLSKSDFVIPMSKNHSSNLSLSTQAIVVSYKSEIAFTSIYLVCTASVHGAHY